MAGLMENCVTLVKFNFEELLLVKANGNVYLRIWLYEDDVLSKGYRPKTRRQVLHDILTERRRRQVELNMSHQYHAVITLN